MMAITFEFVITGIIALSIIGLFLGIGLDFILFEKRGEIKKEKRSVVATGTMVLFYILYMMVIRSKIGYVEVSEALILRVLQSFGAVCVAIGAVLNIMGRLRLQGNWSNHIKIYDDQYLVTTGVYRLVRHPLYASLMLMLFGGAMVYTNYLSAILTMVVFIPFMVYRARQEEVLLAQEFKDYDQYRKRTGMFFPKLSGR
jgi:protein-S-isoprenylcysteine O-methyltransferase Ste14